MGSIGTWARMKLFPGKDYTALDLEITLTEFQDSYRRAFYKTLTEFCAFSGVVAVLYVGGANKMPDYFTPDFLMCGLKALLCGLTVHEVIRGHIGTEMSTGMLKEAVENTVRAGRKRKESEDDKDMESFRQEMESEYRDMLGGGKNSC